MKNALRCIVGFVGLLWVSGCANGKKIQETAPVAFQQAFYTTAEAGAKDSYAGVKFYIPIESVKKASVVLDSVYFRGKVAPLERQPDDSALFVGTFEASEGEEQSRDFVMSSDPNEEYGNKPPVVLRDFPFDLKHDEAMVSYRWNEKTRYYKLSGIVKKEEKRGHLKYPENIRH